MKEAPTTHRTVCSDKSGPHFYRDGLAYKVKYNDNKYKSGSPRVRPV